MRRLVCLVLSSLALVALAAPAAQARTAFDIGQVNYAVDNADAATLQMSHLPTWLQVAGATASLYAADTGSNSAFASGQRLPRNTFLRVLGGGTSRLQVETYDESGNSLGLRGWVDPSDVLPSAPGTDWLVASKATSLWRSPDADADPVRALAIFTPLQLVDGPVQNRILVRVYGSYFSVLDQGWVDVADSGPALPPQTRVPSPTSGDKLPVLRGAFGANQQQAFLDSTAQAARAAALQTGVPPSVTVAQAILESDWGRSELAQNANNYFGIKAIGSLGSDGVVWMPTSEYDASGQLYQTISAFRAYKSLVDSMTDHDRLLQTAARYAAAMQVSNDPRQFATRLYEGGYSTDPAYADKLVALMDRYELYRLDG